MRSLTLIFIVFAFVVAGCGNTPTVQAEPTISLPNQPVTTEVAQDSPNGIVIASGNVVAKDQVHLGLSTGGIISAVYVNPGEKVVKGQLLAEVDSDLLRIELTLAETELSELTSPMSIAQAESDLASAKDLLEDKQDKVDSLTFPRASDERIENNQAEIDLAKKQVALASDAYRLVARLEDGNSKKAQAILNLTNAQMRLDTLIATQNWYVGQPTDLEASIIRSDFEIATNKVQEAEWYLATLKGETIPDDATGTKLKSFISTQLRVESIKEQINNNQIISPFAGTIAKVDAEVGQLALPGQSVIFLVDTVNLEVLTTDLSEKDIPSVFVGQKTLVYVDALGINVDGEVSLISPIAGTLGGDVVYETRVSLINPPDSLLPGMSVDVEYLAE